MLWVTGYLDCVVCCLLGFVLYCLAGYYGCFNYVWTRFRDGVCFILFVGLIVTLVAALNFDDYVGLSFIIVLILIVCTCVGIVGFVGMFF